MFPFFNIGSTSTAPSISGINIDFASANGGESRIITGLNLSSATLFVDGNLATITANTATSITFTVPASSVSTTNGNPSVSIIKVTTPNGQTSTQGIPGNSLWYRPAYFGVASCAAYTAQAGGVTLSGSSIATCIDLTGNGYTLTPTGTAPVYTSIGGGANGTSPYWTCTNISIDNRLENSSFPAISGGICTWSIGFNSTFTTTGNNQGLVSLGPSIVCFIQGGTASWSQYNTTNVNAIGYVSGADSNLISIFTGSTASYQVLNGGISGAGNNPGTTSSTGGIALGGRYNNNGAYLFQGRFYGAIFWPSALNATQVANESAYWAHKLGLVPTVTGINIDFASANGGESRVLTGTNLANATSVTVDGNSATITSNSATSITFIVPASSISSANGNSAVSTVRVVTPYGVVGTTGAPGNSLWYRPAYYGVAKAAAYTLQTGGVTTSAGLVATCIDLSGNGYTLIPVATGPTYSATGGGSGGGLPYLLATNVGTDNTMANTSFPVITGGIGTWSAGANITSPSGTSSVLFGMSKNFDMCGYVNLSNGFVQYNGSNVNSATVTLVTDFNTVCIFNTTSSEQVFNGSPITGGNPGNTITTGTIQIGGIGGSAYNWYGRIYGAIFWPTALNATQVANEVAYWSNQGIGSPTITSINIDFASANGGESRTITGTNLSGITSLLVDGNSATASISGNTATSVTFVVPASSVSSTNGNNTVSVITIVTPGGTVKTTGKPGNSLWYLPAYYGITNMAGPYTAQGGSSLATTFEIDQSGNGYTLSAPGSAPTYNSTGGGSSGTLPYIAFTNSPSTQLNNVSFPAITNGVCEYVAAFRFTAAQSYNLLDLGPGNYSSLFTGTGNILEQYNQGSILNATYAIGTNVDFSILSYFGGNTNTSQQILNGSTPVGPANVGGTSSTGGIAIGGFYNSTAASPTGYYYLAACYPAALTAQGRINWGNYFANEGLSSLPIITAITQIAVSNPGATFRISGSNFYTGTTVTSPTAGTITVNYVGGTTNGTGGTWIDCTASQGLSAGNYIISVNNPTAGSTTATLVVTYTVNPMTIFGTACVGWYNGTSVTLNSTTVSAMNDLSGMGQTLSQATSANQPTYTATDSNFASQPSLTFNGSSDYLNIATFNLFDNLSSSDCVLLAVTNNSNSALAYAAGYGEPSSTGGAGLGYTSQKPITTAHTPNATWGSTVTTTCNIVAIIPGVLNPTVSINVNNGVAVTASATSAAIANLSNLTIGRDGGGPAYYYAGSLAAVVVVNQAAAATAANLAAWNTYCINTYGT